jgi:integrase
VQPALTLLAETGMRFGELQWLTWEDIDLAANVLHVRPKDGWKPKSGDQRAVPLSPAARRALESLPRRWRWAVTMPPSRSHPQPGRQWTERRLLAALKRVLKAVGLPGKLHTFRHTFISHALLNGVPAAVVREWAGHVDEAVIRLYTHVHDDASQAAMRRLAGADQGNHQEGKGGPDGLGQGSAQTQHSEKEAADGLDGN